MCFPPFGDLHKQVPAPRAYAKWSKLPHLWSRHKVKHCFLSISVEDPAKNNQIIYSGQNGFLKLVICPKGLWSNGGSSCVKREWVFMASGMNYLCICDLGLCKASVKSVNYNSPVHTSYHIIKMSYVRLSSTMMKVLFTLKYYHSLSNGLITLSPLCSSQITSLKECYIFEIA